MATAVATVGKNVPQDVRLVPSGKVYRQMFDAQVQLANAYEKVKEKFRNNPPEPKPTRGGVPLVREGRGMRGHGFLTKDAVEWTQKLENDPYGGNPVHAHQLRELEKMKHIVDANEEDKNEVAFLPDEIEPEKTGSDIAERLMLARKKKHEEAWEDMIQEIGLVNLSLEPFIEEAGKVCLQKLADDNILIEEVMSKLKNDDEIKNSNYWAFEDLKTRLLQHNDKRKKFIEEMDQVYLKVEDDRVEKFGTIFHKYAEILFKICYLNEPDLERTLDTQVQELNFQILKNKKAYAELYAKLITMDVERERNQVMYLESRRTDWRQLFLVREIEKFEEYINALNMIKPENAANMEEELRKEQQKINENRTGLINALKTFKPPESTKTAVYNWHQTIRDYTKLMEELNSNYIKKLRENFEVVIQNMMDEIDKKLKLLVSNSVIEENEKQDILETKLLPVAGKKQKEFEDYLDMVERNIEEANQIMNKEIFTLFKYLQGIAHAWDNHQLGLSKQERSLQELLQDSRRDHDTDNQKREEKLDAILDQMRESSSERDLRRLLQYAIAQLENIKKGYLTFHEHQREIIKQYPGMVRHELNKYEEYIYRFFSLTKKKPKGGIGSVVSEFRPVPEPPPNLKIDKPDTFRNILKEILNTDRGTKFYVITKVYDEDDEAKKKAAAENADILSLDELIPNTKPEFLINTQAYPYLIDAIISLEAFKDVKDIIRLNFLNHYENWTEDANVRSNTIVAAKYDEIDKELELRLHLHEPRARRTEMDVHNVRAAELIMHEERVDRHCAGIEETIDNMQKQYDGMQNKLVELATQYRSDTFNLESEFVSATKSLRLIALQEKLVRDRDRYMDDVKTSLRSYRSKFDETLQYLRNSNAKFRKSFNVFSEGGNFSTEEIDMHKKKLEKMAVLIDRNETLMLKEMEKLEKKQLDEATKIMLQFQDKFKYHLIDLQFIEKISRWLNESQVKIKTEVAGSNRDSKNMSELIKKFEKHIDSLKYPHPDKVKTSLEEIMDMYDTLIKDIYKRAAYLKCFKEEFMMNFRREASKVSISSSVEIIPPVAIQQQTSDSSSQPTIMPTITRQATNPKIVAEDPAIAMMKNIMKTEKIERELAEANEPTTTSTKKKTSDSKRSSKSGLKKSATGSRAGNVSGTEFMTLGEMKQIMRSRRAKTREEMYAYYCAFGEEKDPGTDFVACIKNVLRDTLEGILTNSELFYRDVQTQSRPITRPQSIKDTFSEFAEAMIHKLKSYLTQCNVYQNQSLKEFREILERFEIVSSQIPYLILNNIYTHNIDELSRQLERINQEDGSKFKKLDTERAANEAQLRPNLGHPSKLDILNNLHSKEAKRQDVNGKLIDEHNTKQREAVMKSAETFFTTLIRSNESLLLKFDEILTMDEVNKHEVLPEKHDTSELIKRRMLGLPLEDPEAEPLIKRGPGKWNGLVKYNLFESTDEVGVETAGIVTAKTTLAHRETITLTNEYYEKFKSKLLEHINSIKKSEDEMKYQFNRFVINWSNSIKSIKKIHE